MILSFSQFTSKEIELKYLNTRLCIQRKDIYFINSAKVYYNVVTSLRKQ